MTDKTYGDLMKKLKRIEKNLGFIDRIKVEQQSVATPKPKEVGQSVLTRS